MAKAAAAVKTVKMIERGPVAERFFEPEANKSKVIRAELQKLVDSKIDFSKEAMTALEVAELIKATSSNIDEQSELATTINLQRKKLLDPTPKASGFPPRDKSRDILAAMVEGGLQLKIIREAMKEIERYNEKQADENKQTSLSHLESMLEALEEERQEFLRQKELFDMLVD